MEDLKGKAVRGGLVKAVAQAANFILRVGSLMILARLLDPADFGMVAMVTAVTGVFSLFKDAGLSAATVQRDSISNDQISALFWINMLVGVVLSLLSVALAPALVAFYHEPRLFWVTVALGLGFFFNAAGVQHSAIIQRQMRFVALSMIEILALCVSTAVGIGLAVAGYGYWALVGMAVILPAATSIGAWLAITWVPGMPRRKVGIRSMILFGGKATLNSLVVYIGYNLEKVLLGRFWGANALGIYGRAYQLINIPAENLNSAVGGVAFSALSRLQDEPDRLKSYFLKGYSLVLALSLPATIACALLADDIILIVLGPKWIEVVSIFRLLTPTVMIFALINPFWWLLYATGLVGRSLKIALVLAPLVIAAYLIGLPYGPNGVALAYSAVLTLWLIPHIAWCVQGTMVSFKDVLQAASRPLISGVIAAVFCFLVQFFVGQLLSLFPRIILGASVLVVVYFWSLLYLMGQKDFYLELLRGAKRRSFSD
jgi:O-antigen/teichoic acid export membrane protein